MPTTKAIKKAEQARISAIGDFKKRMGGDLELPSGFVVKYRNPGGMRAFLTGGTIPNSLMGMVKEGMSKGKAPDPEELMKDGEIDPQMLSDMNELMDNIALQCIKEPKIAPRLTDEDVRRFNELNGTQYDDIEDIRDDNVLYVDEIPDDDKQFLFQLISGGTRSLEEFLQKRQLNVDSLAEKSKPQDAASPADGAGNG